MSPKAKSTARALVCRPAGADGTWVCESTRDGVVTAYPVDPNRLICDCKAGARFRPCAHLSAVLEILTVVE